MYCGKRFNSFDAAKARSPLSFNYFETPQAQLVS